MRTTLPPVIPTGCLLLLALFFLPTAKGEEATAEVELEAQTRFVANSDLATTNAQVSQWSNQVDLSLPLAGSKNFGLGVDLVAEKTEFRFRNFDGFISGATSPLSRASQVSVQPTLALTLDDHWTWVESASIDYSGASGAQFSEALLLSGSVAGVYRYGKNLKIGLGVQVSKLMPHSSRVLPFPIIDWRFERWSLTSLDGETGRLAYAVTNTTSFYAQLEFRSRDIRLARTGSLPSGILHYETFPLFLGLQRTVNKHLTLSIFVGSALDQQYRFEDRSGQLLRASSKRSPLCGGLDLDCIF